MSTVHRVAVGRLVYIQEREMHNQNIKLTKAEAALLTGERQRRGGVGGGRQQLWFAIKTNQTNKQTKNGVTANTTIRHGNATPGHHLAVGGKTHTHIGRRY